MKDTNFFSSSCYIFLPTRLNPKVALAADNKLIADNSFKLYNPFSNKAKLLKKLNQKCFVNFNPISQWLHLTEKKGKGSFIRYLENELEALLVSSTYFATAKDKVVIQLQTPTAELIGYVKFPLNNVGRKRLQNEKKAIDILNKQGIVDSYILSGEFEGTPFLLLHAIEGEIGAVDNSPVELLLSKLKRDESYKLSEHPRVINLRLKCASLGLDAHMDKIDNICRKDDHKYQLVFEHGDFTPWNIIKHSDGHTLFDFEYVEEEGIEHFDRIKFHYQIGKLINKLNEQELIDYVLSKFVGGDISNVFQLFLIKEIVKGIEDKEDFEFECQVIKTLENL